MTTPVGNPKPRGSVGCSVVMVIVLPSASVVVITIGGSGVGLVVGGGTTGKIG